MTPFLCISVAALIYVCVLSPTAALLFGRVVRNRNQQVPSTPPTGEAHSARRRAVRLVR